MEKRRDTLGGVETAAASSPFHRALPLGGADTYVSTPGLSPSSPSSPSSRSKANPGRVNLDFEPGTMVHQFEVIRELGRGGMGTVLLARDNKLARLVALKFLGLTGGDLAQRFIVEARSTASCSHENIVVIYQVDEWQGAPYMALEYLEGTTLEETLLRQRPSVPRVVEIATAVTRALARAHGLGFVHCDLKPANILLTRDGNIKVLDFGIARIMKGASADQRLAEMHRELSRGLNLSVEDTGVSGTLPYMSFEQWGLGEIDHRTDIWAMGIILWEALTGLHPLGAVSMETIMEAIANIDAPLPSLASVAPHLPEALVAIVDRCLAKEKNGRFANTSELLAALEQLNFLRREHHHAEELSPFLGMAAFQEANAEMFFGREREVAEAVARLTDKPLLVLAGPSGIGKSSFVRAGLVPALKQAGAWHIGIARPGRRPLEELVNTVLHVLRGDTRNRMAAGTIDELYSQARNEPGALGALLRTHARTTSRRVLIFIDQFEETFTLSDPEERDVYLACLLGLADDASSPLRLTVSIRSDFLDRMGENPVLRDRMAEGLMFMQPLGAVGLKDALQRPVALLGYAFEAPIVEQMVASLNKAAGALPLLQFCAEQLWLRRDQRRQLLTQQSYLEIGGIEGALAQHAEGLVREFPAASQRLLRAVLARLVTAEGTRAVVERAELEQLGPPEQVRPLLDRLVNARLLSADVEDANTRVELIHESLITHWPSLKRWRDESGEDAAFLHELRPMAKQWDTKGRPAGMLWTGDALLEARAFLRRYEGALAARESGFLDASIAADNRAKARKRNFVVAGFVL
ncbi:MAG TPA: serine/threonine-protein kinase, partial [Kofleriaceae bacterium]|nr:serine/threonine-protein kinase [Kofleriaceae bacterium]